MEEKKTTSFRTDKEIRDKLEHICKEEGKNMTEIIKELINVRYTELVLGK